MSNAPFDDVPKQADNGPLIYNKQQFDEQINKQELGRPFIANSTTDPHDGSRKEIPYTVQRMSSFAEPKQFNEYQEKLKQEQIAFDKASTSDKFQQVQNNLEGTYDEAMTAAQWRELRLNKGHEIQRQKDEFEKWCMARMEQYKQDIQEAREIILENIGDCPSQLPPDTKNWTDTVLAFCLTVVTVSFIAWLTIFILKAIWYSFCWVISW